MAASSRTRSGPNVSFERGHRDRLIAPTMKKVSPGLSPTAAAIIHKAQAGRFSIPHVPPLHRRGGWRGDSQQLVNSCPITKPTTSRCSGNGDPEGADNFRDIGEHNIEILCGELRLSPGELSVLAKNHVI